MGVERKEEVGTMRNIMDSFSDAFENNAITIDSECAVRFRLNGNSYYLYSRTAKKISLSIDKRNRPVSGPIVHSRPKENLLSIDIRMVWFQVLLCILNCVFIVRYI